MRYLRETCKQISWFRYISCKVLVGYMFGCNSVLVNYWWPPYKYSVKIIWYANLWCYTNRSCNKRIWTIANMEEHRQRLLTFGNVIRNSMYCISASLTDRLYVIMHEVTVKKQQKLANSIASFFYPTHSSKQFSLADVQWSEALIFQLAPQYRILTQTHKLGKG